MGKNLFTQISLAAVLAFTFYWIGKSGKAFVAKGTVPFSPVTTPADDGEFQAPANWQNPVVAKTQALTGSFTSTPSLQNFETQKTAELYQQLFDKQLFARATPEDLQKVSAYFTKAYPRAQREYNNMVVGRLGVLKALEQQQPLKRGPASTLTPALKSLYTNILNNKNEDWLVKRQAFKNLKSGLTLPERERWYSHLDSRVVSLAANSESEIVQGVLREATSR